MGINTSCTKADDGAVSGRSATLREQALHMQKKKIAYTPESFVPVTVLILPNEARYA